MGYRVSWALRMEQVDDQLMSWVDQKRYAFGSCIRFAIDSEVNFDEFYPNEVFIALSIYLSLVDKLDFQQHYG